MARKAGRSGRRLWGKNYCKTWQRKAETRRDQPVLMPRLRKSPYRCKWSVPVDTCQPEWEPVTVLYSSRSLNGARVHNLKVHGETFPFIIGSADSDTVTTHCA